MLKSIFAKSVKTESLNDFLLRTGYAMGIFDNSVSILKITTNRKRLYQKILCRFDFRENESNSTFQIFRKKDFDEAKKIKEKIKQFAISGKIFVERV